MKVLISGSSGLIGTALARHLHSLGHSVTRLVRGAAGAAELAWDPAAGRIGRDALGNFDVAVHLAGENIAGGRWTAARKARIRESRVAGTRLLAESMAGLARPPRALIVASAVGYYGDRGGERLTEESGAGAGFLAEVCRAWEAAAQPAAQSGIRVVNLRFGMVLSGSGGALARMLPPFRAGLGGPLGKGRQYMSWIGLDDVAGVVEASMRDESLRGPLNVVAPQPVTNREFTRTLGRVLRRPAILPAPAFALRLAFGEMADALLLSSARVVPERLQAAGYRYLHPELEPALRHTLGRTP